MKASEAYAWLCEQGIQTSYLASAAEVLAWDQRTYMPTGGHAHRAEQLAAMARLLHARSTDPQIAERLAAVEGSDLVADATSPAAVNVREWRRDYERSTRVPERLAVELARAAAEGETTWERARPANDWAGFAPKLRRILELLTEKADALGYEHERYDALLEDYEPGATAAQLEVIFTDLRVPLVALLDRIRGSRHQPDVALLGARFPVADQQALCREIVGLLGYDFDGGRLDVTAHPFTIGIGPGDVRITTRYQEEFFPAALFGAIHEAGHALYEQGLPAAHWGLPVGQPASLGMHESQSRLWENLVGRSAGFWRHALPLLAARLPALAGVDFDRFVHAINAVEPGLIRVEADEVTYNLHILLRFELELALLRGDLPVADLPEAWDAKMRQYLGVTPPDVRDGVLQDIHWAAGLVGYFPTYTLGNLFAAQLFDQATTDLGDLAAAFARGEFAPLLTWLRERVHARGATYSARNLVREVTGADPDPRHLVRYCEAKYGGLYQL